MGSAGDHRWRIRVDTGGTFTDAVAVSPDGETFRRKVLSSSGLRGQLVAAVEGRLEIAGLPTGLPAGFFTGWKLATLQADDRARRRMVSILGSRGQGELEVVAEPEAGWLVGSRVELRSPEEAPVLAARLLTGTPAGAPLPPLAMRLATTRGTNALLERRGTPTALFVTRGFADLLVIGDQRRPELFTLAVDKPAPLCRQVFEVDQRLDADGSVLRPLDEAALAEAARLALQSGCEAAAVAFLHSYLEPEPERAAGRVLRAAGFGHVALSAELAPMIKILPRAQTAVVDAYLSRVLEDYLDRVAAALGSGSSLHVMTSAGGLVRRESYRAKDSLLSGPAGGVIGAGWAGAQAGLGPVIAFDMGGTSTDVSRHDGEPEYVFEQRVGDALLASPGLAIETVAAGGGSVCGFDGAAFTVGPESAGADPGPACYGAGGPLTVTDVNLLLGRLDPERFGIPLVPEAAVTALGELLRQAEDVSGAPLDRQEVLAGLLRIADERMAEAIRRISVRRGYAASDHALVAFGGAGGQHACSVAEILGITTVSVPPDAGLLSAVGLGVAAIERFAHRQILQPLAELADELEGLVAELAAAAREEVAAELSAVSSDGDAIKVRRGLAELRWIGQESVLELEIPADPQSLARELEESFCSQYADRYGYLPRERAVELVSLRIVAASGQPSLPRSAETSATASGDLPEPLAAEGERRVWWHGGWISAKLYDRSRLRPGSWFDGPALVVEEHCATVVPAGWRVTVPASGALLIGDQSFPRPGRASAPGALP